MRNIVRTVRETFHPLFYLRKLPLARATIRLLDRPVWMRVPGVSFKVRGRLITHGLAFAATGSQETNPEALALSCLHHLNLRSFWDVGANIGHYSWLLKSAAPELEVVLFEPLPANTMLIRATLKRCALPGKALVAAGASDRSGTGLLRADAIAGATSSLESDGDTFEERHFGVEAQQFSIPLVSIDEERAVRTRVDMMKIDVEGHESAVLRGAQKTIAADQPVLFVECSHPGHECLAQLEQEGYRLVDADRLSPVSKGGVDALNYFGFPSRLAGSIDPILATARAMSKRDLTVN
jgi:FkbM family methyltransferase